MSLPKNILITGASSIIMKELIEKINENDYKIWAVTRDKSKINNSKAEFLVGNICDPIFIDTIINEKKIAIVIHAAAISHSYNIQDYNDVNFQGTIHLVNASKKNKVSKFIFISTRAASLESGAYGFSKLKAENYIKTNFDNWLIIRPSEIFGGNKKEGINKLIDDLLHKKIIPCPLNVKSKLFPIYYQDAVQRIYELIFDARLENEVKTINGKEGFSYYELIHRISKTIERKIFIIPVPKFILFIIQWMVKTFSLKIGIFPDQVSRLYSLKETQQGYNTLSVEEYALSQIKISKKLSQIS